ncbi:MAG: (d)CMP kinase, partial [Oligoflexia bacterium]|nr:(d)CMP kinase [Oligoflexia bacterium]
IATLASEISKIPRLRTFLVDFQRRLATTGEQICIMEGRDIGTIVFPQAFCKIFLTASLEVRTRRRLEELNASGNTTISYQELFKDITQRDQQDTQRKVAPLLQADDAVLIDTSTLSIVEVEAQIARLIQERRHKCEF